MQTPSNTTDDSQSLVNKRALAAMLSVSPRTVDNFIAQKKIPIVRISSRCVRFSPSRVFHALKKFEILEARAK